MNLGSINDEALTPLEASLLLIALTEQIGFKVTVDRRQGCVSVRATCGELTVAVQNDDGSDDGCLHAALITLADRIASVIDDGARE